MTGPEHYQQAENLLALAAEPDSDTLAVLARAQVHATLALAAAAALFPACPVGDDPDYLAWYHAASIGRPIGGAS